MARKFRDIDDYLAGLPAEVQEVLAQVRATIHAAVPGAEETISYNMPTMVRGGRRFLHFAGWAQHISLYPVPDADEALTAELVPYLVGQGTLKFPRAEPIPYALIGRAAAAAATPVSP